MTSDTESQLTLPVSKFTIRESRPDDDKILAVHCHHIHRSAGFVKEDIVADHKDRIIQHIHKARRDLDYRAFVAEIDGHVVGSISCQQFSGLYPLIIHDSVRKIGYIWGPFVDEVHRGQGLGRALLNAAVNHLRSLNFTRAVANITPGGRRLFKGLGFVQNNDMRLDLQPRGLAMGQGEEESDTRPPSELLIRQYRPDEEEFTIAAQFHQMWLDNDLPSEILQVDYAERVCQYIQSARESMSFMTLMAEVDGQVVGSASCQMFGGLHPMIVSPEREMLGYIWGVYVARTQRGKGIGRALTQAAVDHLRSLRCTHAILHASPSGKSLYERLGFVPNTEWKLDLR